MNRVNRLCFVILCILFGLDKTLSVYLDSISLSFARSLSLSSYLSSYQSSCLSSYWAIYLSSYRTVCRPVCLPTCVFINPSIYLSVYLHTCLSVSPSVYPFNFVLESYPVGILESMWSGHTADCGLRNEDPLCSESGTVEVRPFKAIQSYVFPPLPGILSFLIPTMLSNLYCPNLTFFFFLFLLLLLWKSSQSFFLALSAANAGFPVAREIK